MIRLLVVSLFTLGSAHATTVVIDDVRCVPAAIDRVHATITDFASYSTLPGARLQYDIPGFGSMPMLTMTKSKPRYSVRLATQTNALIGVELRPTNLGDAAYYPRFILQCSSAFDSSTHFKFVCSLNKNLIHYGLQDFNSSLDVQANAPECAGGQTRLVYRLALDSNSHDVAEIKDKVTQPYGPIGGLIRQFFNEDSFFRGYYSNFYDSWAQGLK